MPVLRAVILFWVVLGLPAPALADQVDARLESLFGELRAAPTTAAAAPVEKQIWAVWLEIGDETAASFMNSGIEALGRGDLAAAIGEFDRVVEAAPDFAEGWNRRATAHFLAGNLELSLRDIEKTLELEPRHFGALSGRGLVYVRLGNLPAALDAFEAALAVNPQMSGPLANAEALRRALKQRAI